MDGKGEGHHYHQKACHTEQGYIKYNVGQLEQSRWHNLWSVPAAIHASNRLSRPPYDGLCRVEHIYLAAKGFKAATEGKCHWLNGETYEWIGALVHHLNELLIRSFCNITDKKFRIQV